MSDSAITTIRVTRYGIDGINHAEYSDWLNLAKAIVLVAVQDYINVLRKLWKKTTAGSEKHSLILNKLEIEEFFHSDWYEALTHIDPDVLIQRCRVLADEEEKAAIRRDNKKKIDNILKETI